MQSKQAASSAPLVTWSPAVFRAQKAQTLAEHSAHLRDLVSCYDVVKQVKQLTMLLRLDVKVAPVR
jgi:hypothetical protein